MFWIDGIIRTKMYGKLTHHVHQQFDTKMDYLLFTSNYRYEYNKELTK